MSLGLGPDFALDTAQIGEELAGQVWAESVFRMDHERWDLDALGGYLRVPGQGVFAGHDGEFILVVGDRAALGAVVLERFVQRHGDVALADRRDDLDLAGVLVQLAGSSGPIEGYAVGIAHPLALLAGVVKEPGHRAPGANAVVGDHGTGQVASAGADADRADVLAGDFRPIEQELDRAAQILDFALGMLELARLTAAFAEMAVIEGKGDEAALPERLGVIAGYLFFDAGERSLEDDTGMRRATGGYAQDADNRGAADAERDPLVTTGAGVVLAHELVLLRLGPFAQRVMTKALASVGRRVQRRMCKRMVGVAVPGVSLWCMVSARSVVRRIKELGKPTAAAIYRRHGVTERTVGLSYADLNRLRKEIGVDNELARALWRTGLHDARVLATMVAAPSGVAMAELDRWISSASNYIITDAIAELAARSPRAQVIARRWLRSRHEWTSSAGWNIVASQVAAREMTSKACAPLLDRIERSIHRAPNRTRYAMNNALIAIGGSFAALRSRATAVARAIGPVEVDHGDTGCKTPDAVTYIEKMAERQRKSARRLRVKDARARAKSGGARRRAVSR